MDAELRPQNAPPQDAPYVFVSYAPVDGPRIKPVVQALIRAGLRLWIDNPVRIGLSVEELQSTQSLPTGGAWADAIENAIDASGCVLALVTPAYLERKQTEARRGAEQSKLVACRIGDVLATDLPPWMAGVQMMRLDLDRGDAESNLRLQSVVEDVRQKLRVAAAAEANFQSVPSASAGRRFRLRLPSRPPASARSSWTILAAMGLASSLLFAWLAATNGRLVTPASQSGILDHQSAASAARVNEIQAAWAQSGVLDFARQSMIVDLAFVIVVAATGLFGALLLARRGRTPALRGFALVLAACWITDGVTDLAETGAQLVQAFTAGDETFAALAASMGAPKALSFSLGVVGLIVGLVWHRFSTERAPGVRAAARANPALSVLSRLARPARAVAVFAACACLVIYGLAQVALQDAAREFAESERALGVARGFHGDMRPDGASRVMAQADFDGAVRVYRGDRLAGLVRGHAAPVAQAVFVDDGAAVLTMDATGGARVTRLDALPLHRALEIRSAEDVLRTRLWEPYGAPVARLALRAAAQVAPLPLPAALQGRRGRAFRDCADCPEMMALEAGAVITGTPRQLEMIAPFAIGRRDVTVGEWNACVAGGGCNQLSTASLGALSAPLSISLTDAEAYARWVSTQSRHVYRLPTDAEWAYATGGGAADRFGLNMDLSSARWTADCAADDACVPQSAMQIWLTDKTGAVVSGFRLAMDTGTTGGGSATPDAPDAIEIVLVPIDRNTARRAVDGGAAALGFSGAPDTKALRTLCEALQADMRTMTMEEVQAQTRQVRVVYWPVRDMPASTDCAAMVTALDSSRATTIADKYRLSGGGPYLIVLAASPEAVGGERVVATMNFESGRHRELVRYFSGAYSTPDTLWRMPESIRTNSRLTTNSMRVPPTKN